MESFSLSKKKVSKDISDFVLFFTRIFILHWHWFRFFTLMPFPWFHNSYLACSYACPTTWTRLWSRPAWKCPFPCSSTWCSEDMSPCLGEVSAGIPTGRLLYLEILWYRIIHCLSITLHNVIVKHIKIRLHNNDSIYGITYKCNWDRI